MKNIVLYIIQADQMQISAKETNKQYRVQLKIKYRLKRIKEADLKLVVLQLK